MNHELGLRRKIIHARRVNKKMENVEHLAFQG